LACGAAGYYLATLSKPEPQGQTDAQKVELATGVEKKDNNQAPAVLAETQEGTRAPVSPVVVLNPGTADSAEKSNRSETTKSAATRGARRSGDDSSRSRPTSYRSYKDLRNFTLNR
jgi:hypothetical protein